ncbi:DUF5946 family protein [Fodinicola feengrottensis]|uniref:Uncharacterized protein n=1 Tax=Fodinicola feengrottensis TaxID=435914 RepID=A0ABP4T6K1_9ACTN|nr:DUF5946 family protein [Fodinicola feengrottensis]
MATDEELFHALLALDHSRQPPWGPLHGAVVAAYVLQHETATRIPRDDQRLETLRAFVGGRLGEFTAGLVRRNSHRRPPSAKRTASAELVGPPRGFTVTIADVAVDGTFPADGYEDRLRAWATDVLSAWSG